jgi:protein SCO1/2
MITLRAFRFGSVGTAVATFLTGCVLLSLAERTEAAPKLRPEEIGPPVRGQQDTALKGVRLEQRLGSQVPTDIGYRDETGKPVRLNDYLGDKPLMIMQIQFRCTMLCTQQIQVLLEELKELKFTPGKEFNLLIVSIDPREGPELAAEMKQSCLERYGRPEGAAGWHFLTGSLRSITRLAEATGFHYLYDDRTDQFAHPDGVMILTPQGTLARYFFRLDYAAQGLRLGLVEAAGNRIGTALDALALLCFHYNPLTGKYTVALMSVLRLCAIFTVLTVLGTVITLKSRERGLRRTLAGGA